MNGHDVAVLYRAYGYAVFRRCLAYLADVEAAHAAVRRTFVGALRNACSFNAYGDAQVWLYRAADELCVRMDYEMSEDGSLTVKVSTASHYRYIDFSDIASSLYNWLERAISDDLIGELDFLVGVERTRQAMRAIVDMPDRDAVSSSRSTS